MAYMNTTRTGNGSVLERVSAALANVKTAVSKQRLYSRTVRELSGLTDRELADLGIHRSSIGGIAGQAAYGK